MLEITTEVNLFLVDKFVFWFGVPTIYCQNQNSAILLELGFHLGETGWLIPLVKLSLMSERRKAAPIPQYSLIIWKIDLSLRLQSMSTTIEISVDSLAAIKALGFEYS